MSAVVYNAGPDILEKKFFDLVVQPPPQPASSLKLPDKSAKVDKKPEKRLRHAGNHLNRFRLDRRRLLVGNKKSKEKEVKKQPQIEFSSKILPLEIALTPNPSALLLQSRILHEIKDAEQNALLLKNTQKHENTENSNADGDNSAFDSPPAIPQVIELGLVGVFELIRETASQHNVLCCKALQALLHMLEGQKLEGMKDEPAAVLEELFQTLLDLSRMSEETLISNVDGDDALKTSLPGMGPLQETVKISSNIPSLACSCLLSLVFAWGNTEKLLAVVASFIADCSSQKGPLFIKIPATFVELQRTVMASVLEKDYIPTPLDTGILKHSLFQSFKVDSAHEGLRLLSIQCDGSYLFALFSNALLMKVGTGYNSTVQGFVYNEKIMENIEGSSQSSDDSPKQLFWIEDSLYFVTAKGSFCLVHRNDLSLKLLVKIPPNNDIWFAAENPCVISPATRQESYTLKNYSTDGKKLIPKRTLTVCPTKQHIIKMGKALPYNPIKEPSSDKEDVNIAQILVGDDICIIRTSNGQVLYAGNSHALGFKGKSKKVVTPESLPLPTTSKINHACVAGDASHVILIAESGEVYFVGTSSRGEDGEVGKSKRQPPQKPKLMKCIEGKKVVTGYCNHGTSALVTENGRLYLFGKDSTQADSKTGLVSSLNDVHVSEVAMGRAHIVVRSDDGRIWTAGVNNRGQCGRQEGTISISQRIAEVEQEKDVSMPEDKSMEDIPIPANLATRDAPIAPICSPDKHKWKMDVCMVCALCCECTGYGSRCINAAEEGRYPGMVCGCGSGWSGCMECGCCKTCAGEADVSSAEKRKGVVLEPPYGFPDIEFPPPDEAPPFLNKLAMLFHQKNAKKGSHSSLASKSNKGQSKADLLKEVALLPFVQVSIPKKFDGSPRKAIKIACGDHHTIVLTDDHKIYVFGKNNYGQLGVGDTNNRNVPTLLHIDHKVAQVACGNHHSLLLTSEGVVYGFGSNAQGQLGSLSGAKASILTPQVINFQPASNGFSRVNWISASQKISFIKCDKVLLGVEQLESAKLFGNSSFVGISYKPLGVKDEKSRLLLIDQQTSHCHHYTEDCIEMNNSEQACVDIDHNVLWSFDASNWTVKSYLLCGYKDGLTKEILPFSPPLAISLRPGSLTTRTQAGLNLLACLNTLVLKRLQGVDVAKKSDENTNESNVEKTSEKKVEHTADEYNTVSRFKRNGGGWGYSVHSTEAIRFMTDTDVHFGGVGVFGGRGEYTVTVAVYEDDGESEKEGEALVETDRIPYECGFRDKFRVLFDDPVAITAGQWYTVTCRVSGPSSDCGSHGEQHVVGSDNVKFTFRRSKRSNNGTDVSAGQIPELLYSIPTLTTLNEVEVVVKPKHISVVQTLSKHFCLSFKEGVFESLPYILDWARTSLFMDISKKSIRYDEDEVTSVREKLMSDAISNLSFVVNVCLRLLRQAVKKNLATGGNDVGSRGYITQCMRLVEMMLTDGEIDAALNDALVLTCSDRDLVVASSVAMVTECHHVIVDCLEAFHPSPLQKWNSLHQSLENYNTASASKKPHMARLLVAILDSLCQPAVDLVQCLPLFPRTLSNLASIASPGVDAVASTSESPSVNVAEAGFYDVAYALVEIACVPAQAVIKFGGEGGSGNTNALAKEDNPFSNLLLFPGKSLITSSCKFLSTLASSLAYRATNTSNISFEGNLTSPVLSANRFDMTNSVLSWDTGNGTTDGICFNVDADGVQLCGVGVYVGGSKEHKYELKVLGQVGTMSSPNFNGQWDILDLVTGSYTSKDSDADFTFNVKLNKLIPIQKKHQYAIWFQNYGDRTHCGENGKSSVKGSDGTTFYFSRFDQSNNGTGVRRGQIPTILYQRSPSEDELLASPSDKWMGTAVTPTSAGLAYQRHALNVLAFVTESTVEIFKSISAPPTTSCVNVDPDHGDALGPHGSGAGSPRSDDLKNDLRDQARSVLSTELVCKLLPELFFHVGTLVKHDVQSAVEVMETIRTILPPLITIQQLACPSFKDESKTHKLVVESAHPYKAANVEQYKASFPPSVKWMLLEFAPESHTGQPEDFVQIYLTQGDGQNRNESKSNRKYPVLSKMTQDKNWPQDAILLPGHKICFALETASDYTNTREQKPHLFYGFKCTITGYESVPPRSEQDGSNLINELINTAGLASSTLMNAHDQLWTDSDHISATSSESVQDKIEHLKAIERTAAATLERHSSLFLPGLHLDSFPTASQALTGDLPFNEESKEKMFLHDFISATNDTTGGRLARWLQPDSYVDPKQCSLRLNTKSLFHTLPTSVTITTRDQYGKPAYVPSLKVELTMRPHPSPNINHDVSDSNLIQPSPVFETPYEATRYKDSRYHAISMMRAYRHYSFEELRIAYPFKRTLKNENILVAHASDETYSATWIPSLATTYTLQVTFDHQLKGPSQVVTVAEAPHGHTEKAVEAENKLLKFVTPNSRGLRIRSNPTLQSMQIGLLQYEDIIGYCEQLRNDDGIWVKLTTESAAKYCKEPAAEAWCILYHKHNGRTFLVPVQSKVKLVKEVNKKSDPKPQFQPFNAGKKLQKLTAKQEIKKSSVKHGFNSISSHPFMAEKKSDIFKDPFPASLLDPAQEWKEKVPGEYKVAKCGKAGHNIRYNPCLKAAPIGKLILGNVFLALSIKRNKGGVWLLLHKSSVTQFCEDPPDERHAWTLAVARDGTQHLQLKEIAEQKKKAPSAPKQPAVVGTSPFKKDIFSVAKQEQPSQAAMLNGNVMNDETTTAKDYESVASSSRVSVASMIKSTLAESSQPVWKAVVEHKHRRSPSESDALKQIVDEKEMTSGSGSERKRLLKEVVRSHSSPGARSQSWDRVSTTSKRTGRTTLVQLQSLAKSNAKTEDKPIPPGKIIRGGRKTASPDEPDIPFIDEAVDAEGNMLSPADAKESVVNGEEELVNGDEEVKVEETRNKEAAFNGDKPLQKVEPNQLIKLKEVPRSKQSKQKTQSESKTNRKDSRAVPQAVSPLVAECARAVFASFLWHEGIVHDAMACASYLKFNNMERDFVVKQSNTGATKEFSTKRHSSASSNDESPKQDDAPPPTMPPVTLTHLAKFWDCLSETITKIAVRNQTLPPPTPVNQNLNRGEGKGLGLDAKRKDSDPSSSAANDAEHPVKANPLKRKAFMRNDHPNFPQIIGRRNIQHILPPYFHPQQLPGGQRDRKEQFREMACDLCDTVCPYPVTYHMKRAHPGCGKFARGLGYNSSGHYCGGWAGDCGDGGVGGSTWYLLCVTCRDKYLAQKNSSSQPRVIPPRASSNWISKLHHLLTQPADAHQVMKSNALFLLNLVSATNNTTPTFEQSGNIGSSRLDVLVDDVEMNGEKIWAEADLLPFSTNCFCSFPAIPCAYVTLHGKENGINNNVRSAKITQAPKDYRNRSLSNQATPSSGHFKNIFTQRLSMTPDSAAQKAESILFQGSSKLMRSVSTGSQPQRRRTCSGGDTSPDGGATGSFLLHNPSPSMKRLMRGKSGNSNNIARDAVHGSSVLPFVTQRHDLKSLEASLQVAIRRAALRVYVLQALTWLLRTVVTESSIHDILWYFVSTLAGSSSNSNRNGDLAKNSTSDVMDDEIEETKPLYEHPVQGILNAGMRSISPVVESFHGFLQTVSDIIMDLPPNRPVQLMAIRCWSLKVLPSDHQFLHKSNVFSHISQILSKVETKSAHVKPTKLVKVKLNQQSQQYVPLNSEAGAGVVSCLVDLTSKVQINTSSHASIANSLTDNSTETFWESGDEDKNRPKHITISFNDVTDDVEKLCVHIDNTRDVQKKVTSAALFADNDEGWNKTTAKEVTTQFAGWIVFDLPSVAPKLKVEFRGPDNGLRVRQVKLLGHSQQGCKYIEQLPGQVLRAQMCEAEVLKVFKLLTAEVFGQLLSEQSTKDPSDSVNGLKRKASIEKAESDHQSISGSLPVSPSDFDPNLREHMVGILFSRSKLTSLQKKVFEHTVQAIHTETIHIRKVWEGGLERSPTSSQKSKTADSDTYCFELLSMILALSGSDVGCHYVAQQSRLIDDFISLLHIGTPRIQRQITLLLRRVLSQVTPNQLAVIMSARIPRRDKLTDGGSVLDQSPSPSTAASSLSQDTAIALLDPFFACIAKSLTVQIKGLPASLQLNTEEENSLSKRAQPLNLQSFFPGRPAPDCTTWWVHGSVPDQSTVEEIIKLLVDMSANKIAPAWENVTKCAISEALLSLTQLPEGKRDPVLCMRSPVVWLALASLCVLDRDHVEKLTSARSSNNRNKFALESGIVPVMAPCIQLHRFLALQDKERTHIYTFLVENPQEISSFDVRSREFQFAGHRWYVYTGKPNNEYFSFYLRIVNLGNNVRVHTVYSFNVINFVNHQNSYIYHSPPTGRVFSRDDDALSWGWKEFIRRETLLKPNGGFFFDGNKVLVELECKTYKTVYEESVELPQSCPENPYPMIHTSPFSVGGFAWQIRIFPNGPDEDNRGNVALFLHCTTANHLAKVKAKFLIENQPSPAVYEHTFPPNCISEMPSGVAFPNKGDFMDTLKENHLNVGVVFITVSEVNEVHVTLSEPNSFPTVCVTPFEDLTGCPWVLKTLQATKLKLKMDQNEKTTCGLMEFYHRHVMWNATLVSPGSEDVSLNVPLNTKGSMIGYFGENWSDADVIKSDLVIDDLASTDNPYRIDVDDGYDRYSYVSIHVEIASNHLLYKTPTPSPTGDRERKLLYNARKDRHQIHGRYQELLRQKALLESKCKNLERERSSLTGKDEKDDLDNMASDVSKLYLDVLADLSNRAINNGTVKSPDKRSGRHYIALPGPSESERQLFYAKCREKFDLLVSNALPDPVILDNAKVAVEHLQEILIKLLQTKAGIRVTHCVVSGSLGMETVCRSRVDVDLVMMSSDFPRNGHVTWLPSFVLALYRTLEEAASDRLLPDCTNFAYNAYSVQFQHKDIEVDLYLSYDWRDEGGFEAFYEELLRQRTSENLSWFCSAAAERQKLFIQEQSPQVKDMIMVVKQWRNSVDWTGWKWRPSSYLLSLLIIRAYENACLVSEGTLPSNKSVLIRFVKLVQSTQQTRPAAIRISWGRFYDPKNYNIEYSDNDNADHPPVVQDPANPANNVAEQPASWLLFRKMLTAWAHDLGLVEEEAT